MLRIVLYQPEIPPNTGNIIRLCANTGCSLHLIEPLGFLMTKRMRRAGWTIADMRQYSSIPTSRPSCNATASPGCFGASTRAMRCYVEVDYRRDAILFGPETRGLPAPLNGELGAAGCRPHPMLAPSRSLNLNNAVCHHRLGTRPCASRHRAGLPPIPPIKRALPPLPSGHYQPVRGQCVAGSPAGQWRPFCDWAFAPVGLHGIEIDRCQHQGEPALDRQGVDTFTRVGTGCWARWCPRCAAGPSSANR